MRLRPALNAFCLSAICFGGPASGQSDPFSNAFFGFEFILQPLAVKWSCGGPPDDDLAQIDRLITAFPDDAETANLADTITAFQDGAARTTGTQDLLGFSVSDHDLRTICNAALPLQITGVTPDDLLNGTFAAASPETQTAWETFYTLIDQLHAR